MNDREMRRHEGFNRVTTFGDQNATGSKALTAFASLKALTAKLDAARAGQQSATGPTAKEVLLDALRLDLQSPARAIALETPGFADTFRLPDVPTEGTLLTTADAYLTRLAAQSADDAAAKAHKAARVAQFVAHELPAGFVTHLKNDLKTIRDAQAAQETGAKTALQHRRHWPAAQGGQSASYVERAPQREKNPTPPGLRHPRLPPRRRANDRGIPA